MVLSEKGMKPCIVPRRKLIEGVKEIHTEREINNNILGAELVGDIAFGIGKPGYRGTPFGCIDNRGARDSNPLRCIASVDLLDICQESERIEAEKSEKCTSRDQNHALISVEVRSIA
jgi:hypothetical protein